jgi:hypothetical protein
LNPPNGQRHGSTSGPGNPATDPRLITAIQDFAHNLNEATSSALLMRSPARNRRVRATLAAMDWSSIDWPTVAAVASAIAAIGSAVAGVGAWFAARRSAGSSERAADAAGRLTAIESERTHRDLIPEFRLRLDEGHQGVSDNGELTVELFGPAGLDFLDEVTIEILDEAGQDHWARGFPDGFEKEAARFVWGPWEFNAGAAFQVADNKVTKPRRYSRVDGKNWDRLSLKRTRPGSWMTGTMPDAWQKQVQGPMRLSVNCRREGYAPWYLLYEVSAQAPVP